MTGVTGRILPGPLSEEEPALELAFAHALVRRASAGDIHEALRVCRPLTPMVVFGRRDARLPGFADAVKLCRAAGFATAIRATGGRPVAYTQESVVVDHVRRDGRAMEDHEARFLGIGRDVADLLVKLVGTAPRIVKDAWLFSSLIIADGADQLRPVLAGVYRALDLPIEPASVGSVRDEARHVDALTVQSALLDLFDDRLRPEPTLWDSESLGLARQLLDQHQIP